MYKQFDISFKIMINKRLLAFKTQDLYCHELISCKLVNFQKPDIRMKVRMKSKDESYRRATRNFLRQNRFLGIGALL